MENDVNKVVEKQKIEDYLTEEDLGTKKQITVSLSTLVKVVIFGVMFLFVLLLCRFLFFPRKLSTIYFPQFAPKILDFIAE